ncbi:hypothetical protein VP01_337g6 [Puccinia sorghi]|uniref:Integrase catalytic domain-containing protein n=1 Tax=Puccinia sorghi TaxID=27349 RepID=A0A0L6UWV4_9BASI|nr:hypothetical protein VP01_337g6 [Puccinia sorghi]
MESQQRERELFHRSLSSYIQRRKKDATLPIKGRGSVKLTWGSRTIQLENCLFVPNIVINLISVGKLSLKGCEVHSKNSTFNISKGNQPVLKGTINNRLFTVNNPNCIGDENQHSVNVLTPHESLKEEHEKFGHTSIQRIDSLIDKSILKSERVNFECKSCILAKITKQPFKERSKTVSKPFEQLHLDLVGPINPESTLKHRYIITVVENHSGYLAGFPLVNKDDTTDTLIALLESEHWKHGYFPTTICSEGGGEFIGNSQTLPSGT